MKAKREAKQKKVPNMAAFSNASIVNKEPYHSEIRFHVWKGGAKQKETPDHHVRQATV